MSKPKDAKIIMQYTHGDLSIATTPENLDGIEILPYLGTAMTAIIASSIKDPEKAVEIALNHATALVSTVANAAGQRQGTSGKIVVKTDHVTEVSPIYLHCVIQKLDAPASKGKFFAKEGNLYVGVDNSTGDAWTEEFTDQQNLFLWLSGAPCRNAHGQALNT